MKKINKIIEENLSKERSTVIDNFAKSADQNTSDHDLTSKLIFDENVEQIKALFDSMSNTMSDDNTNMEDMKKSEGKPKKNLESEVLNTIGSIKLEQNKTIFDLDKDKKVIGFEPDLHNDLNVTYDKNEEYPK